MDNKINLNIELNESTINRIEKIVNYENSKNQLKLKDRPLRSIEDFIKGAVIRELQKIEHFYALADFERLNKKSKLKNNIRQYIKYHKIKQRELAIVTGMDEGSISHILNNRNQPTLEVFIKIWVALNCPPIEEILYRE